MIEHLQDISKVQIVMGARPTDNPYMVINGGTYKTSTGELDSAVTVDGKALSAHKYSRYGYGIDKNCVFHFSYDNAYGYPNFIGAFGLLIKDGQILDQNPDYTRRGVTAIGQRADMSIFVVVTDDRGPDKMTSLELAQLMFREGCVTAIRLDCGGSSQVFSEHCTINSGRKVAWWIAFYKEEGMTTLRRGSKGAAVGRMQKLVGAKVDNDFGKLTEADVKVYQAANGLVPDGVVGPATWASLLTSKIVFKNLPINGMILSKINSPFGMRRHPITKEWKLHEGVDYPAPYGTQVVAVADGVVSISKMQSDGKGYGNYIVITHGEWDTLYCHLSKRSVSVGQKVKAGQQIGAVGTTGSSTGNHLHFGLCGSFPKRNWTDPLPNLKKVNAVKAPTDRDKVKDKYVFDDNTMEYLAGYRFADALFKRLMEK